jgi:hypothetical protein
MENKNIQRYISDKMKIKKNTINSVKRVTQCLRIAYLYNICKEEIVANFNFSTIYIYILELFRQCRLAAIGKVLRARWISDDKNIVTKFKIHEQSYNHGIIFCNYPRFSL